MRTLTMFSNFPDRFDNMRIPFCLDLSLHSGYLTVGTHSGRALLYRYASAVVFCPFFDHEKNGNVCGFLSEHRIVCNNKTSFTQNIHSVCSVGMTRPV